MSKRYTPPRAVVLPLRMTASRVEAIIREIAQDSGKIIFGNHTLEHMDERNFSDKEIIDALKTGVIIEAPRKNKNGEWQCIVVKRLRGVRDVVVRGRRQVLSEPVLSAPNRRVGCEQTLCR